MPELSDSVTFDQPVGQDWDRLTPDLFAQYLSEEIALRRRPADKGSEFGAEVGSPYSGALAAWEAAFGPPLDLQAVRAILPQAGEDRAGADEQTGQQKERTKDESGVERDAAQGATLPPLPEQEWLVPPSDGVEAVEPRDSWGASSNFDALRRAIARAAAGGEPVRILHYGASHVAAGIQSRTLEQLFKQDVPVEMTTKAKVGVSARYPLAHKEEWLDQPIAATRPDLIIIAFGNNEAAAPIDRQAYARQFETLLLEVRRRAPDASIMVVGPTDGYSIVGANKGRLLPGLDQVIDVQKEVAARYGVDFFDSRGAMGGRNAIQDWRARGLAASDMLHFTSKGYQLFGRMLYDHIVEELRL